MDVLDFLDKLEKKLDERIASNEIPDHYKKYHKNTYSTYMDNWPVKIYDYSIPTIMFQLTKEELRYFSDLLNRTLPREEIQHIAKWQLENVELPKDGVSKELFSILNKIEEGISYFPESDGVFIRLGSRSPKDMMWGERKGIKDVREAFNILTGSIRVTEDIFRFDTLGIQPVLVFRPWIDIKPQEEFRCFVRKGELIAITQYEYYNKPVYDFLQDKETRKTIKEQVENLLSEIRDILPDDSVVLDIIWKKDELIMLELNPYRGYLTDPCCFFSWKPIENIKEEVVFAYLTEDGPVYEKY